MSRPKTVLSPRTKITVRAALKKHGLVNGIKYLKAERGITIGLAKAGEVAAEAGLTFQPWSAHEEEASGCHGCEEGPLEAWSEGDSEDDEG